MRNRWTGLLAPAFAVAAAGVVFAQSNGTLRVDVTASLEPAEASVEVLPQGGGEAVASGSSGGAFDLPPGTYDVEVTLTEAIDDPVKTKRGLRVEAGLENSVTVNFDASRVTLVCRRGDGAVEGKVRIRRPGAGAWLPDVRCGEAFIVSGGSYEAEVTPATGPVVAVDRLQIMSGATQRIPVAIP